MNEWKRRRLLKELTQAELARRMGRAQSWVSTVVERGGRELTEDEQRALDDALGDSPMAAGASLQGHAVSGGK